MRRLTRNLRESSIDAFVCALGLINQVSVSYRTHAFVILLCNAWELLMKAKLYNDTGKIYYPKRRNEPRRSLSMNDCLKKCFPNPNDPMRLNLEKLIELRDQAVHLVIPFVPPDIMGLFQANVLNFAAILEAWFAVRLTERVPLGMLSLVYDVDPSLHNLSSPRVKRQTVKEQRDWLEAFQHSIASQADELGKASEEFYIPITLKLALVKHEQDADVTISSGPGGKKALVVDRWRDWDNTHPYRQKDVIEQVNKQLGRKWIINQYDVLVVRRKYDVESNEAFCHKSRLPGRSAQYSTKFVNWLVSQYEEDSNFFDEARHWYRENRRLRRRS